MQITFLHRARYWLLLFLVFLITISSHPAIVNISRAAGKEQGTILSSYIILVFGVLFILCFNFQSMMRARIVRRLLILLLWMVLWLLMTMAIFGSRTQTGEIGSIGVCLVAIMIGWQLQMGEKQYKRVLIFFSGLIVFVGMMQVLTNVGGFVIEDLYYVDNKNSLGAMLATGAFVFFYMFLNCNGKGWRKLLLIGLCIMTMAVLLTIRARTATLTAVLLVFYLIYERFRGKNLFFYALLGVGAMVVVLLFLPSSIKDYVYNSFFQNYEGGDVTSGRMERNKVALAFIADHPWIGNLEAKETMSWVHNYILYNLSRYGLIFSLPIMVLYLYLLLHTVILTFKSDSKNIYSIGYYVLIIPFAISMAEPTFPFGPGTATIFNFIMFGISLRHSFEGNRITIKTTDSPSKHVIKLLK